MAMAACATVTRRAVLKTISAGAATVAFPWHALAKEERLDPRAYAHGLDIVTLNDKPLMIWSSWGYPPQPTGAPNWEHDVYCASLEAARPVVRPRVLVRAPEAQEPASAAVNDRQQLLITCEDGSDGIHQRAGLWNADLSPRVAYPLAVGRGGHSGHAAAIGDTFLVAFAEGWSRQHAAQSFRGLGAGEGIWLRWLDSQGAPGRLVKVSGHADGENNDWPMLAASQQNALIVWQQFPTRALKAALVSPTGVAKPFELVRELATGYAYDVCYLPSQRLYVVVAAQSRGGFCALIDLQGRLVYSTQSVPPITSEGRAVPSRFGSHMLYPVSPSGAAVLAIDRASAKVERTFSFSKSWEPMGTSAIWLTPRKALVASLTKAEITFEPIQF